MQPTEFPTATLTFCSAPWLYAGPIDEDGERPTLVSWSVIATSRYGFRFVYTGKVADEAHAIRLCGIFALQVGQDRWDAKDWREVAPSYGSSLFQVTDPMHHWLDDDEDRDARARGLLGVAW